MNTNVIFNANLPGSGKTALAAVATKSPPKAGSRLALTFAIHNALRQEKDPPQSRYCVLLALAIAGTPLTGHSIGKALNDFTPPNGTLDSAERHGLIEKVAGAGRAKHLYQLTAAGLIEVNRLMNPPL